MLRILVNPTYVFQNSCINLHTHNPGLKLPIAPYFAYMRHLIKNEFMDNIYI